MPGPIPTTLIAATAALLALGCVPDALDRYEEGYADGFEAGQAEATAQLEVEQALQDPQADVDVEEAEALVDEAPEDDGDASRILFEALWQAVWEELAEDERAALCAYFESDPEAALDDLQEDVEDEQVVDDDEWDPFEDEALFREVSEESLRESCADL